jgi:diacylglycerol O-acyltransferase / wax synthase
MLDEAFLDLETSSILLHTGGLGIFGAELTFADVVEALEARLHRVPLARKRLQPVAFGAGRPVWVDDDEFELSYHLRHAALRCGKIPCIGKAADFPLE